MIALWAPAWSVIAAGAALDEPAATVERGRVTAATPVAVGAGVRVGMRVRDAHRLSPQLGILRADPDRAARLFEPVVYALEEVAAGVEVARPGLCVLDAAGPSRYFGGEEQAAALLREAAASVQTETGPVAIGAGIADGMVAAVLAARTDVIVPPGSSAAFLAGFDVAALAPPPLALALRRLGIRGLGQFAALPVGKVATRFGAEGVRVHRLARGLDEREPAPRRAPSDLAVEQVFDPPVAVVEPLVFAAKALADRLHARLSGLGLVCDRVGIEAVTGDGRASSRWWRHEGRLTSRAVAERTRWQASAWMARNPPPEHPDTEADHVDGGAGFVSLLLRPDGLRVATGTQGDLLGGEQQLPGATEAAIERLQDLLGHTQVARPVTMGGRTPGDQVVLAPFGDLDPEPRGTGPWPGTLPPPAPAMVPADPMPVRLLDRSGVSVVVTARGELPQIPVTLVIGAARSRVTGFSRPWPVHERPWEPGGGRRLARVQVMTEDGAAYLLAAEGGRWLLLAGYQ